MLYLNYLNDLIFLLESFQISHNTNIILKDVSSQTIHTGKSSGDLYNSNIDETKHVLKGFDVSHKSYFG